MGHVRQSAEIHWGIGVPSIRKINRPLLPFPLRRKPIDEKPIKEEIPTEPLPIVIIPVELKPTLETIEPSLKDPIPPYFGEENEYKAQVY